LALEASKIIAKLSGYADTPFSAANPPYFTYIEYGAYYLPGSRLQQTNMTSLCLLAAERLSIREPLWRTGFLRSWRARDYSIEPATAQQMCH
jgi:hypothetical protein